MSSQVFLVLKLMFQMSKKLIKVLMLDQSVNFLLQISRYKSIFEMWKSLILAKDQEPKITQFLYY